MSNFIEDLTILQNAIRSNHAASDALNRLSYRISVLEISNELLSIDSNIYNKIKHINLGNSKNDYEPLPTIPTSIPKQESQSQSHSELKRCYYGILLGFTLQLIGIGCLLYQYLDK